MPAPSRTASPSVRDASSDTADFAVATAFIGATVSQTSARKVSAAASHPSRTAADAGVPTATAATSATTPTTTLAATRAAPVVAVGLWTASVAWDG